jgi:lysophospholipase L1-like esterase
MLQAGDEAGQDMKLSRRRKKFAMAIVTIVAAVIVLEGAARIAQTLYDDFVEPGDWYVYSTDLGWEPRPGFSGRIYEENRELDSEGFFSVDTAQIAGASKPAVVTLGDSTTFGYGVDVKETFTELLDDAMPGVDVINLSVPGYTSYQGYKVLLKQVDRLAPFAVVVSFGFNDRRYVIAEEGVDSDARLGRIGARGLETKLERIYAFRLVRYMLKQAGVVQSDGGRREFSTDELRARVGPEDYRENLTSIVQLARDKGAVVVFLLLKDNPIDTRRLRMGVELLEQGHRQEAIDQLTLAVDLDNSFSILARKYSAAAYRQLKDEDRARAASTFSSHFPVSVHGARPIHLDTEYNQIVQEVADEHDVALVDARPRLDDEPAAYQDACHITSYGHAKVAELLRERISRLQEQAVEHGTTEPMVSGRELEN